MNILLPLTILVVEDEAADQVYISSSLAKSFPNALVLLASSVGEVRKYADFPIDIALLDLNLPDSRGADTVAAIRKLFPTANQIAISAAKKDELAFEAGREGAIAFVPKGPGFRESIKAAILNLLGQAEGLGA